MRVKRIIGIIDYGVGNHSSVVNTLRPLGYRCCVSRDHQVLAETDLLLLPGVGAFPQAMDALHRLNLIQFLQNQARLNKPIVGICLGMQLLAESSTEVVFTSGLNLIPGKVESLGPSQWHIGWNNMEVVSHDPVFRKYNSQSFYFNHSYVFHLPQEYLIAVARFDSLTEPFPIVVRSNNVVGLQFHPEKSQVIGKALLSDIIEDLCNA